MSLNILDLPGMPGNVRRYLVANREVRVTTDDSGLTTVRAAFGSHRAITGAYLNDTEAVTAFHNEFDGRYAATLPATELDFWHGRTDTDALSRAIDGDPWRPDNH